jgi:predicted nucleic acid-binding protein
MSLEFVIDSYAWIEYFLGSEAGKKVRKFVEGAESATPTMVVAELSRKLQRKVKEGVETEVGRAQKLEFVRSSTVVIPLDWDTAARAGEIDSQRKDLVRNWGLADSIVLATAVNGGAKVVTGDRHFADLKDEIVFVPAER